jgi:hypothetical protein
MTTRIMFNGQEYASAEAMPEDVRKVYQQALAQLADAGHSGIPDVLERGGAGNVIGIQNSSITVNGKTYGSVAEMPALNREPASAADEDLMRALDQSENVLSTILVILLAAAAGAVIVFGSWMITHMDESSRSQGGVLYVSLAMVVVLGAIAGGFINLWWRRQR